MTDDGYRANYVYPLRLSHHRDRYWVNNQPIDRETYIAIRGLMGNPKVSVDLDHWIKTGEHRFVAEACS